MMLPERTSDRIRNRNPRQIFFGLAFRSKAGFPNAGRITMTSTPFDTMLRTSSRRLVPVALIGLALVPGCAAPASKGQNAQGQNVTSTCFYYRAQYADAMAAFMRHQDTDPAAAAVDVRTAARMVLRYRATDDADHDTCFGPDELELMRRVYGDNGS